MYCKCNGKSRKTTSAKGIQTTCSICGREKDPNPYQLDGRELKVGDRLWSLILGWVRITELQDIDIRIVIEESNTESSYHHDGVFSSDVSRTLFWDEIVITPPPPPKRKVKAWRWVYKDSYGALHITGDHYTSKEHLGATMHGSLEIIQKIDSTKKLIEEE